MNARSRNNAKTPYVSKAKSKSNVMTGSRNGDLKASCEEVEVIRGESDDMLYNFAL